MNSVNWLMRALSAHKIIKKALKKGRNYLFYMCLRHKGETHSKKLSEK